MLVVIFPDPPQGSGSHEHRHPSRSIISLLTDVVCGLRRDCLPAPDSHCNESRVTFGPASRVGADEWWRSRARHLRLGVRDLKVPVPPLLPAERQTDT